MPQCPVTFTPNILLLIVDVNLDLELFFKVVKKKKKTHNSFALTIKQLVRSSPLARYESISSDHGGLCITIEFVCPFLSVLDDPIVN